MRKMVTMNNLSSYSDLKKYGENILRDAGVSEFENDALLSIFYEVIMDHYNPGKDYAIMFYFGTYDIPVKGTDGQWNEGSEEIYDFVIGAIAPYYGDYEVEKPEFGFLFPAFSDRSSDKEKIDIYNINPQNENKSLIKLILNNAG